MLSLQTALTAGNTSFLMCLVYNAFWIIYIVAYWSLFKKAGEKAWKCLIPVYNTYLLFKRTWSTKAFWAMFGCGILALVTSCICIFSGGSASAIAMGSTASYLVLISAALALVTSVAAIVIQVMSFYYLSKSFGHGIGYFLGLTFLSPIFMLILGLGRSRYLGPKGACTTA